VLQKTSKYLGADPELRPRAAPLGESLQASGLCCWVTTVSSLARSGWRAILISAQRARLADIAERTPVTLTLKQGVKITTTLH
jgi:hypothetical protein